jgi:membrane peptidoglycan carboxypeptidase
MKKLIFKLLFWIFIILFVSFSIILGLGYLKYRNAIDKISISHRIQEIRNDENYTKLDGISDNYKNAVIAIEDHRFYSHSGIDILSIIRSTYVNLKSKSLAYGASTIPQQVGRLMYFTQEKSFIRKVSEVFVAFELEKNYSKNEILELYLNLMYFGNGYYGITEASYGYFDKSPENLTLYESTYLAGLPNAPSIYSGNDELAEERRLQVVNSMKKHGYID